MKKHLLKENYERFFGRIAERNGISIGELQLQLKKIITEPNTDARKLAALMNLVDENLDKDKDTLNNTFKEAFLKYSNVGNNTNACNARNLNWKTFATWSIEQH